MVFRSVLILRIYELAYYLRIIEGREQISSFPVQHHNIWIDTGQFLQLYFCYILIGATSNEKIFQTGEMTSITDVSSTFYVTSVTSIMTSIKPSSEIFTSELNV